MSSLASMQSTIQGLAEAIAVLNPPIKPRLRAPASEEEIRSAEANLGLDFPEDLKHFLLCHDGQDFYDSTRGYGDPLVPMMRQPANGQGYSHYWLGSAKEIVESTRSNWSDHEWLRDVGFAVIGPARYHDRYIIFTGSENADCLALDMLPEVDGVVGQVAIFSTQAPQIVVVAPDLETYLRSLAAGYKQGRFHHSPCEYFVSYADYQPEDSTFD
ncbi:MAG TPA: SMI1/KNR4 family protein [Urbifossiella sp.]|nr:SMI1/KNR4 family protein [Urbifossiella sp.]